MNDFLMNSLASDRIDGLRAEADRDRLGRAARLQQRSSDTTAPQRRRHFQLSWLLRRSAA